MTSILQPITPLDIWGTLLDAGRTWSANFFGGIIEFGMVIFLFVILIGCIIYFTGYSKKGLGYLVNGIVMEIVLSCIFMAITGATGPPDISIFFRAPGA